MHNYLTFRSLEWFRFSSTTPVLRTGPLFCFTHTSTSRSSVCPTSHVLSTSLNPVHMYSLLRPRHYIYTDLTQSIVPSTEQYLRRIICKCHRIHINFVSVNLKGNTKLLQCENTLQLFLLPLLPFCNSYNMQDFRNCSIS